MARLLDVVWCLYFATHIPITIFVDSQALFSSTYYPDALVELKTWYTREFKDCLMADPTAWFLSFVVCEMLIQFPYILVATYAFFKGPRACPWIRIPNMIYSSHVITTLVAIGFHIMLHDASQSKVPCPKTQKERLTLLAIYSPYFIIPLLMLLDGLFNSSAYLPLEGKGGKKRR
ncbi:sigma intracellular receptor 2-like [Liolophura sinensis]|uniref:sigma intracellular receptor 2-like n=1 Tax=Liolophura sinensis TaxID=3198878 RepID=UPI00315965FB